MIALLAAAYLAIGLGLAVVAARRRARAVELVALVVTWPLYAPLWLDRSPPADERLAILATALDRVGHVGATPVSADDAPAWMVRITAAAGELAALERALAAHAGRTSGASPALTRAWAERCRRHDALRAVEALFTELAAQVGLASWVGDADRELRRAVEALDAQLAILDPAPASAAAGE